MKTLIDTPRGPVRLVPNGECFALRGSVEAVQLVMDALPVLSKDTNPLDIAGDVLARVLLLDAADGTEPGPLLISHAELVEQTFTENPLILFQTRETSSLDTIREHLRGIIDGSHDEAAVNSAQLALDELDEADLWKTERVFLDPREAKRFVEVQRHRYPEGKENEAWRYYVGIAAGVLTKVAKEARDMANL